MEHLVPKHASTLLRIADLSQNKPTYFEFDFDAGQRRDIAAELQVPQIRKLRFSGKIESRGKRDWELTADLGASITQDCVVTLEPVQTRLDEQVSRLFLAEMPEVDASEIEMPEDDSVELTPETLDLIVLMKEALSLSIPPFPRAESADLGEAVFTEPGKAAMTDEEARPFAGLGALRDSLANKASDDEN